MKQCGITTSIWEMLRQCKTSELTLLSVDGIKDTKHLLENSSGDSLFHIVTDNVFIGSAGGFLWSVYCRKNYLLEQKPNERNTKKLLVWQ